LSATPHGVIAPFGAGCASIVYYPYRERERAVLGLFDVSARPCVPAGVLTFAVAWPKFVRMIDNAPESFLITASWEAVRARLGDWSVRRPRSPLAGQGPECPSPGTFGSPWRWTSRRFDREPRYQR
jgi:hypothetical protein